MSDRDTPDRYLGGSSNCWAGFCRPLDEEDFTPRSWVPDSGWPITRAELLRHMPEAHRILKLGPVNFDPDFWIDAIGRRDVQHMQPNHPDVRGDRAPRRHSGSPAFQQDHAALFWKAPECAALGRTGPLM